MRSVAKASFADFQRFHYYSGWPARRLEELKIGLTQPSLAGTWTELGNGHCVSKNRGPEKKSASKKRGPEKNCDLKTVTEKEL